jgi:beta-galactosidase GanA
MKTLTFSLLILTSYVWCAESPHPIPRIEKTNGQVRLVIDGAPFLMLGGQVHNSTSSNPEQLIKALDSLVGLHANFAEVPLYWESIEPNPGQFDFHSVDDAVQAARQRALRLVFLWFGTWKNGESHYVPEWVKRDKAKYRRATGSRGEETAIISPFCEKAREADQKAFAARCATFGASTRPSAPLS